MKKIFSLVLVAVLLLTSVVAFAAGTPSKTTGDLARVESGSIMVVPPTDEDIADYTAIYEEIVEQGKAPVEVFPAETIDAIADALPDDVDPEDLEMNEVIPVALVGEETAVDPVMVLATATPYSPDQAIVAVLKVYEPSEQEFVLEAVGNEDGTLTITFTDAAIEALDMTESALLFILSK